MLISQAIILNTNFDQLEKKKKHVRVGQKTLKKSI